MSFNPGKLVSNLLVVRIDRTSSFELLPCPVIIPSGWCVIRSGQTEGGSRLPRQKFEASQAITCTLGITDGRQFLGIGPKRFVG